MGNRHSPQAVGLAGKQHRLLRPPSPQATCPRATRPWVLCPQVLSLRVPTCLQAPLAIGDPPCKQPGSGLTALPPLQGAWPWAATLVGSQLAGGRPPPAGSTTNRCNQCKICYLLRYPLAVGKGWLTEKMRE
ncbi:hypothetical protein B296_00039642 [Ensete ventricosum]|uniref:Uncharacterized protein n=1 Tax=Ensete ventricosum TaxID=4639 RepID=A0A426Y2M9_ENSVE|nr:hypothetical protein B296_00039642 [Ensete ventricosum]